MRRLQYVCDDQLLPDFGLDVDEKIETRLEKVRDQIQESVRKLVEDGRYNEAESILNQLFLQSWKVNSDEFDYMKIETIRNMSLICEELGNLPMAEKCLEGCFPDIVEMGIIDNDKLLEDVRRLNRLYTGFYRRLKNLDVANPSQMEETARLAVLHRIARLDIEEMKDEMVKTSEVGLPRFPLHVAINAGAADLTEVLLKRFPQMINDQNCLGTTALHYAVILDKADVVRLLLDADASVDIKDLDGRTALHDATRTGRKRNVSLLLGHGADVGTTCRRGMTALHYAAAQSSRMTLELLLNAGASHEARDVEGRTPLHLVPTFESGYEGESILQTLLDAGALIDASDNFGATTLMIASKKCDIELIEQLLDAGANADSADQDRRTPLLSAVEEGSPLVVNTFIAHSVNLNTKGPNGRTALHLATLYERFGPNSDEIFLALVDSYIDKEAVDNEGQTALMLAIKNGKLRRTRLLLDRGADVSAVNPRDGDTLLHWAVRSGEEFVALLLEKGANTETKDRLGQAPLHLAASHYGSERMFKLLVQNGANIEARDPSGWTPLHMAALYNSFLAVQHLVDSGADTEATDRQGRTPLQLADPAGVSAQLLRYHQKNTHPNKSPSRVQESLW